MDSKVIYLNNNGIAQLDVGDYEKAAKFFRAALDTIHKNKADVVVLKKKQSKNSNRMLLQRRSCQQANATNNNNNVEIDDNNVSTKKRKQTDNKSDAHATPSGKRQRVTTEASPKLVSKKDKEQQMISSSSQQVSPLEQRQHENMNQEETRTTTTSAPLLLGRPVWLEHPKKSSSSDNTTTMHVFLSSILYNLAYTLHQMGFMASQSDDEQETTTRAASFLQRAFDTYTMALHYSVRCRSPVVLFVTCHNLQQLLSYLQKRKREQEANNEIGKDTEDDYGRRIKVLESHKTNVLRLLSSTRTTGSSGKRKPERTCCVVLAMLALRSANSPAAAA